MDSILQTFEIKKDSLKRYLVKLESEFDMKELLEQESKREITLEKNKSGTYFVIFKQGKIDFSKQIKNL